MSTFTRRSLLAASGAAIASQGAAFAAAANAESAPDLRQSQLFLDDTWIENAMRLERSWVSAEIFPEPVLRPDKVWEGSQLAMFGSVMRIGDEWRMYYMTYNRPHPALLCMAVSSDGLHWERPNIGRYAFRGSKENNIVFAPEPGESTDGPTICHDPRDAKAPFKMMYYGFGEKTKRGEYVAFSKDGIVWEHHDEPVLTNTGDRTNLLPQRDHRGKFVAYLRHRDMFDVHLARSIWQTESDDFIKWTDPETILVPDLIDDPNTELYGMAAFPYEGLYLGMLERWYNSPDVIEVQLAWSRNGKNWQRPVIRRPFIAPAYPWNQSWNSCANSLPIRIGNQLWFYFGGRSASHGRETPRSYGAIGLASTGLDQFASIRADYAEGRLTTKVMTWPGGDLMLRSAQARYPKAHPSTGGGSIAVEVHDERGVPIDGFAGATRAQHRVVSPSPWAKNETPVRWSGGRSLDELRGRQVRLVLFIRDAQLYSFRSNGTRV